MPKSYKWCPALARPAGLIGPEETRWEREHPCWPGNTTVYRYFGSWAAAQEAAGIEPVYQIRRGIGRVIGEATFCHACATRKHFGSWQEALGLAMDQGPE